MLNPKNAFMQDRFGDLMDLASNKQLRINGQEYTLRGGMVTIGLDWSYPTGATHRLHERICEAIAAYGQASDQLPLLTGAFRDLAENLDRFSLGLQREVVHSHNVSSDFLRDSERGHAPARRLGTELSL